MTVGGEIQMSKGGDRSDMVKGGNESGGPRVFSRKTQTLLSAWRAWRCPFPERQRRLTTVGRLGFDLR